MHSPQHTPQDNWVDERWDTNPDIFTHPKPLETMFQDLSLVATNISPPLSNHEKEDYLDLPCFKEDIDDDYHSLYTPSSVSYQVVDQEQICDYLDSSIPIPVNAPDCIYQDTDDLVIESIQDNQVLKDEKDQPFCVVTRAPPVSLIDYHFGLAQYNLNILLNQHDGIESLPHSYRFYLAQLGFSL